MNPLRKGWQIVTYLYNRFFADGCSYRAASLTYSTLLSIVPFLIIVFYVVSFFPVFKGTGVAIQNFILQNFIATSANVIAKHMNDFLQSTRSLSWVSMLGLAFASILMMYNLVSAFNAIWHVKLQRHFALSFIIYVLILLLSPLFFGMLLLASSYLASLPLISGAKATLYIKKPLLIILPYVSAFVTFTFFNWVLPSCKVKLWYAVIAGFITTLFFEIAKYLFSLYLTYYPTYRIIYGALATIPLFLVWLYLSWSVILLGAVICRGLSENFVYNN